jgi:hypothetical protein
MDIENILEKEKQKALTVINEYNKKYNTPEQNELYNIINYLHTCLDNENNNEIKKILLEDINIIKEYL